MAKLIVLLVFDVNVAAIAVAALRGIACHRRERAFWRAYDDRRHSESPAAELSMNGHCS